MKKTEFDFLSDNYDESLKNSFQHHLKRSIILVPIKLN